ncbi:MAG: L,D-transpeptidase [Candidatus Saccharimonadales bacterium]
MPKIKLLLVVVAAVIVAAGAVVYSMHKNPAAPKSSQSKSAKSSATTAQAQTPAVTNYCGSNSSGQDIVVSISKQHMWACDGTKASYDNPVITGMQMYPSELTPAGTYHIYSKLTDQTLAGSDFTGHWSDFVNYWMPFLDNQYGTYGFHDLTQTANGANGRADSDFGNVDINAPYTAAKHGSHGCVEMPLAAAKWLYNWVAVGITVTVQA